MAEFDARTTDIVNWLWEHVHNHDHTLPPRTIILVVHGNLMSAVLNGLLFGNGVTRAGLFVHCSTGTSHVELVEFVDTGRRVACLQYLNHTPHLSSPLPGLGSGHNTHSEVSEREQLRRGNAVFKDRWMHEFV